jgi:ABC-2 type transport system permease protein
VIDASPVRLAARPTASTIQQWWVLTVRMITPTLRNGEVLTLVGAPFWCTVLYYIPLKQMMGAFTQGMSSYAQFLMPLIVITGIGFAALGAAFRAATDAVRGISRRFKAMPIAPLTPLASRMSASMYRCAIALGVAVVCGYVIGFRFYGGVAHTVGFCLLVLLIGAALSLLGDLIGAANKNPEATANLMMPPMLVFGGLSVGLQPVERFPGWIHPFVRDQPISQFIYALRALAGDSTAAAGEVKWSVIGPALVWLVGFMVILIPLHAFVASRRR